MAQLPLKSVSSGSRSLSHCTVDIYLKVLSDPEQGKYDNTLKTPYYVYEFYLTDSQVKGGFILRCYIDSQDQL